MDADAKIIVSLFLFGFAAFITMGISRRFRRHVAYALLCSYSAMFYMLWQHCAVFRHLFAQK